MNKKIIGSVVTGVVLIVALILLSMSLTRIPAGYCGVVYNLNGGVMDKTLSQGMHFVSPTKKVTKYTVGIEQSYLTKGDKGDSEKDESFSASSSEGKAMQIDLTYTYQFDSKRVSEVFTKFKGQSGTEVKDNFIKPNIVSWTKEVIARYKVSDVLGTERANVNAALTDYLNDRFSTYGINITNVSLINITVDENTMEAINAKITAQQAAETQEINNQTAINKAKADAEVTKAEAQAKADAQLIEAEAQAEANNKLSSSITDELIRMKEAEARNKFGWVTISGTNNTVVTDK